MPSSEAIPALHIHDTPWPLDLLKADACLAVASWDWSRAAHGHALSLPAPEQLHPFRRYAYENYPCTGLLADCPTFARVFDSFECEKLSFRLLRRPPKSAYAWHRDSWTGPGAVRFQIPIVSNPAAFLVVTDYDDVGQIRGPQGPRLDRGAFDDFARANEGHFRSHHLEIGKLHCFDTKKVHTLINAGESERIILSFDVVANDWLFERYPETRAMAGDGYLPRPGAVRGLLAHGAAGLHPLRTWARRLLGRNDIPVTM
jgi:hypothetical protein